MNTPHGSILYRLLEGHVGAVIILSESLPCPPSE